MTTGGVRDMRAAAPAWRMRSARARRARLRLVLLHLASRRLPTAAAAIAISGVGLRIALIRHWDAYGALQLPLVFESASAAVIAVITGSPFGEAERVAGRLLPLLRLAAALALTALAVAVLTAAGSGAHLAGGAHDVVRNVAGLTGIGLLSAAAFGAGLAWIGPTAYLVVGVYALYTQWHLPALTTPWIWPARPPDDLGGAFCASLVFACGMTILTVRGAREPRSQLD